jgi:signal peptidase II
VVAAIVLVLDQASKWWAWERLREGRAEVHVIDGLLRLIYAENPGIAFSFFNSGAEATRWVLVAASATAACIVAYYLYATDPGARRLQLTLSLLLGGITGNLVDRALMGRVIDFIDLYWGSYHWPTFNVADSAISVGAVLLAWELLRADSEPARAVEGPRTGG